MFDLHVVNLSTLVLSWATLGIAQTATPTATDADGLAGGASSGAVSVATVTFDGQAETLTAVPTLPSAIDEAPNVQPNIEDPDAVDAQEACPGYTAYSVVKNPNGFSANLSLAGKPCNAYGIDVHDLHLTVQYQSPERLSVKISPAFLDSSNETQYVIPSNYLHQPVLEDSPSGNAKTNDLQFSWSNKPSFGFTVKRKSTGDVLFDTCGKKLVFEDQFVEFASHLPPNYNLYGLGEHIHGLRLGNNYTATMFAADVGDTIDENLYGSHPFYLDTRYYEHDSEGREYKLLTEEETDPNAEYVSRSHGVYFRNAHAQEALLRPSGITWRTVGGSIDLYFFSGATAPAVTKQYQNGAIGYPVMQQYFTFGFHQCRWGYTNWTQLQEVIDSFRKFGIPLENIWLDIDYMNQYRDFENDQRTYGYEEGRSFLSQLHKEGQHYIPIVDSAIYIPDPSNASDAYPTYDRGHKAKVFMTNPDGSEYVGAVWPGFTVFPDWRSPGAQDWWSNELMTYYNEVAYDGIWIDMSEPSSFCVGSCGSGRVRENPVHPPFSLPGEEGNKILDYPEGFNVTNSTAASSASSAVASQSSATATPSPSSTSYLKTQPTEGARNEVFPPYVINNANGALPVHGMSPNATHYDGTANYDIHNLWGHEILNATYNALTQVNPGKRPFIIGRSTFAGSGKYAGHWGGDNYSQWRYMFFSIPQALSFSLFGIPMFGADACGFSGNTDEDLCSRWMQMAAFFPFYRNHNTLSALSQEPYQWASVTEASRTAMHIRYSILPYMYTLFYQAHTTGSTVMRALAWEFPDEPRLADADRQFLLGPSLMVTPVLQPGAVTVDGVFPGGQNTVWYDWYNSSAIEAPAGTNTTINAPFGHIPVYVRGGGVIPMQQPGYTTRESRRNPWSLLVALDKSGSAEGQLYLDDGVSEHPNATRVVDIKVEGNSLLASGRGEFEDTNALANATILGVPREPKSVRLNGGTDLQDVSYDETSHAVSITGLQGARDGGAWNEDWELSWEF
ncbi:MAG: hypothetical protein M1831_003443 [Alyxoria varia]|nr:MAG: hypothetical protein M1831_003443 [Alyxoria varia]